MNHPLFLKAARYIVAGSIALLVHLAVLTALVEYLSWSELLSTSLGFLCAVPVNFHLQRTWVFKSSGRYFDEFTKYVLVTITTFLLNGLVFAVLHSQVGIQYVVAQLITTAIILIVNFCINYFFTFSARFAK